MRWQCARCGRFVAESAVHSVDRIDPGAYYGITSRMWADCPRCGEVDNPRPVAIDLYGTNESEEVTR
jgi:hypothetical protein